MMIQILLVIYILLGLLYWLVMFYSALRVLSVPTLKLPASEPASWPSLTVVVPACNEAAQIKEAAQTLLNQDYPNLQLILVNDRSTDTTGQIIDQLAEADSRIKAIHITHLPERWLGKVHALHTGLHHAKGELVLFTDADVHFSDMTLRAVVDYFLATGLDHLAGFPRLNPSGIVLDAILTGFLRQFVTAMRPWKVSDSRSRAFIGIGAFNLVRKQTFIASGGFEWLRMEVADDAGVGLMMKRAGYRCGVVRMTEWLNLYWHRTISQAVRGAEKGWSSTCRFSILKTIILGVINVVMELSPLLAFLIIWPTWRRIGWLGFIVLLLYLFTSIIMARWMHQRIGPHLVSILIAPARTVAQD